MELSVREWMIIIGVLLIVAVLLDGYRRVRSERRNRIRVTLSRQAMQRGINSGAPPDEDDVAEARSELPNGGARVVAKPRRDDLKLDEPVPVLMESVHIAPLVDTKWVGAESAGTESAGTGSTGTESSNTESAESGPFNPEPPLTRAVRNTPLTDVEPNAVLDEPAADILAHEVDARGNETIEPQRQQAEPADVFAEPASPPLHQHNPFDGRALQNAALPNSAAQEVMIVNVVSKDPAGFKGQDLLQILLACDLRFGNMNIFHRYEKANGKGAVQFSVANLVEPGTFNLDHIDTFTTPGLCFFLALPGPEKAITAFNYMVETAQVLVKNLHGELRDEAHSVMTQQTIEHCRQRIRDFERRQLTLHL